MICSRICGEFDAGPIVATILVRLNDAASMGHLVNTVIDNYYFIFYPTRPG
jgi:hypothetical protein